MHSWLAGRIQTIMTTILMRPLHCLPRTIQAPPTPGRTLQCFLVLEASAYGSQEVYGACGVVVEGLIVNGEQE